MKKIALLFIILLLSTCRYFNVSPVNGITTKDLTNMPKNQDLIGSWEVDNFSYELIKEKGYTKAKKIELKLYENGNFEAINFPDFIDVFKNSNEEKFHQLNGKWKVDKDFAGKKWVLNLKFEKSIYYENGLVTDYDLYLENNKLIIWTFIGDPDSGERFLFKKNKTSS